MKIKHTLLALAAMTGAVSASYTITGNSITVGGTSYSDATLSGVNLGTFQSTDTLIVDGTAIAAIHAATVLSDGTAGPGAPSGDNYIHAPNGDGASLNIYIDGGLVSTQVLTQTAGPTLGTDKGDFTWGNTASTVDLIGLVSGAAGTYEVTYEVDYTFSAWTGTDTQIDPADHAPMTSAATFTVVPEPSSTALLGLGGLALILRRRK